MRAADIVHRETVSSVPSTRSIRAHGPSDPEGHLDGVADSAARGYARLSVVADRGRITHGSRRSRTEIAS